MKKIVLLIVFCVTALSLSAQNRAVERVFVSTDKDVYVAGDRIWCSAFCVQPSGALSEISRMAYLELHGPANMAATARIALDAGRGGGYLDLPAALPTGNYRLVAYTAQNKAEKEYDYAGIASKTLSVFNVLSSDRQEGGVEIVDEETYRQRVARVQEAAPAGNVSLTWSDGRLTLANATDQPLTMSLSVWHDDGFLTNGNPGIADFMDGVRRVGKPQFDATVLPDLEGEVIYGHVEGFSEEMFPQLSGKYAYLSSPSDKSDIYIAPIREDGSVTFFTAGIFGNKECVCEIEGIDPTFNCHVELQSPYVNAAVPAARPLPLSASLSDALRQRSVSMQLERRFASDLLPDLLPYRSSSFLDEGGVIRYILDDYTRFTTMSEVFREFIPEIHIRNREDGKPGIQLRLFDAPYNPVYAKRLSMVLLDGVPVFDNQKIIDYDPLLVESVDIYPNTYIVGKLTFEGVVNFVTYKRNLPAMRFDGNARVVDYQGVCLPQAWTGASFADNGDYPDYRQTVYWHPLLRVGAEESLSVPVRLPAYKGLFRVVAEGLSADGTPFRAAISFEVE